jgi:hypothetical protein
MSENSTSSAAAIRSAKVSKSYTDCPVPISTTRAAAAA